MASRLRKQGRTRTKVRELHQAQKRERIYTMRLQYKTEAEIARAVGLSQSQVSRLLNQEIAAKAEQQVATTNAVREFELQRIDALIRRGRWFEKAAGNARTADTLLAWNQRKDRLLGLYVDRHELTAIQAPPNPNEPKPDYSRLTDDELATLERLMQKACGIEPNPDLYPPPPVPSDPAALTDQRDVVAVVEEDETLAAKILRLHRGGSTPEEIRSTLNLSHAEFLAALESKAPRNGASIQ